MRQVVGDIVESFRRTPDGQKLESSDLAVGDLGEWIVGRRVAGPVQCQVDGGGGLRAFEVDKSFVCVLVLEIGPQRGPRCEQLSPSPAYVGECDYVLISVAHLPAIVPIVRNEREDVWRDSIDWCGCVPPGPNEVENFKHVLLENVELNATRISHSARPFHPFA